MARRLRLFSWLTALILAVCPYALAEDYTSVLAEGQQQIDNMDYKNAEKSFAKLLKLAKTSDEKAQANLGLAKAYHFQNQQKKAVDTLLLVLALPQTGAAAQNPEENQYVMEAAKEAWRIADEVMKDARTARKVALKVLDYKGLSPALRVDYTVKTLRTYAREKNVKEMDKLCAKSLTLPGLSEKDRFQLLFRTGVFIRWDWTDNDDTFLIRDYTKAREYFVKAEAITEVDNNQKADLYSHMGDCFRHDKDYASARQYLQKALALPEVTSNWLLFWPQILLGHVNRDDKKPEDARKCYEAALKIADDKHSETFRKIAEDSLKSLK